MNEEIEKTVESDQGDAALSASITSALLQETETARCRYQMKEIVEQTGLSSVYIRKFISRFQLTNPPKAGSYRGHEAYLFDEHDLETLRRVAYLHSRDYMMGEIAELLTNYETYRQAAIEISNALALRHAEPTSERKEQVRAAIKKFALLNHQAFTALEMQYGGQSLEEIVQVLTLTDRQEVRLLIREAQQMIASILFMPFLFEASVSN